MRVIIDHNEVHNGAGIDIEAWEISGADIEISRFSLAVVSTYI
jgi:hypothetical protein